MKQLRLLRLTLKDFMGTTVTVEPGGRDLNIYADNGVGKTRLYSAYLWLLTGKDSLGRADFKIKNLDADGNEIHGLSHEVEAVFDTGAGRPLTLRKVYHEKWTTPRGSAEKVMAGHETDHEIDGVPVSKREYETRLAQVAPENLLRLLGDPMFFNDTEAMKTKEQPAWKVRRQKLFEIGGGVSDDDIIATDQALAGLPEILGGRSLDDHRKVIKARLSKIEGEKASIPVRIDEAKKALPDIASINSVKVSKEIAMLEADLSAKQRELARIESGGEVAEQQRQLSLVEAKITGITTSHRAAITKQASAKQQELDRLNSQAASLQSEIDGHARRMQANSAAIADLEQKLPIMRQKYWDIKNQEFVFSPATVCPACHRPLPEDELQAARDEAQAQFNVDKSERLEENVAAGKKTSAAIAEAKAANERLQADIDKWAAEKADVAGQIASLQADIAAINATADDYTNNAEYTAAVKERTAIEDKIASLSRDAQAKEKLIAEVKTSIEMYEKGAKALNGKLAAIDQHAAGMKRIDELAAQEKTLAAEFEKLQREANLCEAFIRAKISLLEERINSKFELTRYKLFERQVNGDDEECCEALGPGGVPYGGGLNNGHRIIVGMDTIRTLARHYGFSAPIFVDNAESVTQLPAMDGQVIRLIKPEVRTEDDRIKYSRLVIEEAN